MRISWKPKYAVVVIGILMILLDLYSVFFYKASIYFNLGHIIFFTLGIITIYISFNSDLVIKNNYLVLTKNFKKQKIQLNEIISIKEEIQVAPVTSRREIVWLIINTKNEKYEINDIKNYDLKKLYPAIEGMTGKKIIKEREPRKTKWKGNIVMASILIPLFPVVVFGSFYLFKNSFISISLAILFIIGVSVIGVKIDQNQDKNKNLNKQNNE